MVLNPFRLKLYIIGAKTASSRSHCNLFCSVTTHTQPCKVIHPRLINNSSNYSCRPTGRPMTEKNPTTGEARRPLGPRTPTMTFLLSPKAPQALAPSRHSSSSSNTGLRPAMETQITSSHHPTSDPNSNSPSIRTWAQASSSTSPFTHSNNTATQALSCISQSVRISIRWPWQETIRIS